MENVLKELKAAIKERIPGHSYKMWIKPIQFLRTENKSFVLSCPNFYSKKKIQDLYGSMIGRELERILGKTHRVLFEVVHIDNRNNVAKVDNRQKPLLNERIRSHSGRFLRHNFTFDQFVVGSNSDFAYSAALSLASRKEVFQNSLYLISKPGMGKSHLSQAIGHQILSEDSSKKVYYITAEDFTNEMVQAFKYGSISDFKQRYRNGCDVLLLEDIHYLSGKKRTQTELALTLDALLEADKRIIFSSCYLPGAIPKLDDKLRSRLTCGVISNIDSPNFRTRVRILKKKAETNRIAVSDDVIDYLSSELSEDVRQLESGLIGVAAKSSLLGTPIDLNLAQSVVKNIILQQKSLTIDVIKKIVCEQFSISINDIVSRSRKQGIARPRHIAMYLARKYTDAPLQQIGRSFNRYHATALHSIGIVERGIKEDLALKRQVEYLCDKIDSRKY